MVVRTSPVAASLSAPNTLNWSLTAAQWTALSDPAGEVDAISIAVTNTLRAQAWGDSVGVLPPPDWSTNPKYSSAALPVEYRASLSFLATTLGGNDPVPPLYQAPSLSALGGPATPASRFLMASAFQALPFAEPATGLVYARARWYDPISGSFLSPDPRGYEDASNLYAFAGGDPVNGRDPRGEGKLDKVIGVLFPGWDEAGRTKTSEDLQKAADQIDAMVAEVMNGTDDTQWFTRSAGQTMQLASGFLRAGTQSGNELGEGTSTWQVVQNRVYEGMPLEEARALIQDWDQLSDEDRARLISMGISKTAGLVASARGFQQAIYKPKAPAATPTPVTPEPAPAPPSTGTKPKWLRDIEDGINFNKARTFDYPHREVYIENPNGGYYRLDAYDPLAGEIVSRKLTQFSQIAEGTGVSYVKELATKYRAGARIANVPSSGPLAGQYLRGQLILEVPVQTSPIPQSVLNAAKARGIVIRDVFGKTY